MEVAVIKGRLILPGRNKELTSVYVKTPHANIALAKHVSRKRRKVKTREWIIE